MSTGSRFALIEHTIVWATGPVTVDAILDSKTRRVARFAPGGVEGALARSVVRLNRGGINPDMFTWREAGERVAPGKWSWERARTSSDARPGGES